MNTHAAPDPHGVLIEPTTLQIQRLLPGPIERVWAYLTQSELRRRWLASGEMELKLGAPFEFTWRNDELTDPPGEAPPNASSEHSLKSEITALDPPHRLGFTWGSTGGVVIELAPVGGKVLLTLTHHRVAERSTRVGVSAGWHSHLDLLAARLADIEPGPFWDGFRRLRAEYEQRTPA